MDNMNNVYGFVKIASISPDGKKTSTHYVPYRVTDGAVLVRNNARKESVPMRVEHASDSQQIDLGRKAANGVVNPSAKWKLVAGELPEGAKDALNKHFSEEPGRPGWRLGTAAEAAAAPAEDIDVTFRKTEASRVGAFFGRSTAPGMVAAPAVAPVSASEALKGVLDALAAEEAAAAAAAAARQAVRAQLQGALGESPEVVALRKEVEGFKALLAAKEADTTTVQGLAPEAVQAMIQEAVAAALKGARGR